MEAIVAIALFVAAILALIGRLSKSRGRPSNSKPSLRPSSSSKPSAKIAEILPSRFDEESAKHLYHKRIIEGAAWVVDGDTIKINNTQIRLFGIDAPELNHPYGKQAKWALHKLCKGHTVQAEITEEDEYGRTVARCYLSDGRDLSAEMVKQGLALDWPKFSGGKYRSLETSSARKKLFLADARQNGRMYVWEKFEAKEGKK